MEEKEGERTKQQSKNPKLIKIYYNANIITDPRYLLDTFTSH